MKFKKTILVIIIFLSFLGIGSMLSNVQSREADQLLEAYGLSNNTRYIEIKNKQNVRSFLLYLQKKYPHNKIQVHMTCRSKKNQTLVWSNHDVLNLPTESGRYFTKEDFKGRVSFAVLGLNAKVPTYKVQGNEYVYLNKKYYTVVGTLKHYRQMKQDSYYLSTSPKQPTGKFKLSDYQIIIDSSNKVIRQIAKHYGVKAKIPLFVKNHQIHQFSIIREITFIIIFLLIASFSNLVLAFIDWKTVKSTHLKGNLLRNWLINHGIRILLIEVLVTISAYFFLIWRTFLSKPQQLIWLLTGCWIIISIIYSICILHLSRKDQNNA
ncbi:hypothetical protein [Lactobacillus sp. ESL0259]|uniref:hypothetical protein n=1 Tax=Lactobacillus sp. ESL0259 TaxID=2069346 RepID=UPI000EFC35C4|nr:hypothetical protein [Lactobacillus sp. ESL0259]RMC61373.1 hypothetical protein F5ESL0259_04340 [Lactobacillus sp. ESL0259]